MGVIANASGVGLCLDEDEHSSAAALIFTSEMIEYYNVRAVFFFSYRSYFNKGCFLPDITFLHILQHLQKNVILN